MAEPKAEADASTCVTALARASPAPPVARPLALLFGPASRPLVFRVRQGVKHFAIDDARLVSG